MLISDLLLRVVRRDGGRYRNPWLALSTSIPLLLVLLLVVAMFSPSLSMPYTPEQMDFDAILQSLDFRYWSSTDQSRRDVFTRVVYGTPLSLSIGVGTTLVASADDIVPGTLADLALRAIRQLLIRLLDIMLVLPDSLLALLAITVLERGPGNTLQAVGLVDIVGYVRLVCTQVLQVRSPRYVQHAVALGEPPMVIILRHIVPSTLRPLLVLATTRIGYPILSASALNFFELGVTPPTVEQGVLLSEGCNFLDSAPWTSLLPANVIVLSVITITLLGRRVQTLIAKSGIA